MHHGFYKNEGMFACSERAKYQKMHQKRLRDKAEVQLVSFRWESKRVKELEQQLAKKEHRITLAVTRKNASILLQSRWRIFQAIRAVHLRRQVFNSKFLVRLFKYRMHKKRVLRAMRRIRIACKLFNSTRTRVLFVKRMVSSTQIQAIVRGNKARLEVVFIKIRRKTVQQVVHSVILFGFTRAQQCLMGPHTAATRIQKIYRRHLRWRRQVDKRMKRLKHGKASAVHVMKKLSEVVDETSKKEVATSFELPSADVLQGYIKRGASMRMNAEGIYQLVRAAKFMAGEQEKQDKEKEEKKQAALKIHKAGLNIIGEGEEDEDEEEALRPKQTRPLRRRCSSNKTKSPDNDSVGTKPKRTQRKSSSNIDISKRSKRASNNGIDTSVVSKLERKASRRGSRSDSAGSRRGSISSESERPQNAPRANRRTKRPSANKITTPGEDSPRNSSDSAHRSCQASKGDRSSGERTRKPSLTTKSPSFCTLFDKKNTLQNEIPFDEECGEQKRSGFSTGKPVPPNRPSRRRASITSIRRLSNLQKASPRTAASHL